MTAIARDRAESPDALSRPRVAAHPDGRFTVGWSRAVPPASSRTVHRILAASGVPFSDEQEVIPPPSAYSTESDVIPLSLPAGRLAFVLHGVQGGDHRIVLRMTIWPE